MLPSNFVARAEVGEKTRKNINASTKCGLTQYVVLCVCVRFVQWIPGCSPWICYHFSYFHCTVNKCLLLLAYKIFASIFICSFYLCPFHIFINVSRHIYIDGRSFGRFYHYSTRKIEGQTPSKMGSDGLCMNVFFFESTYNDLP